MYKKLDEVILELGVKKKELSEKVLNYAYQKLLSSRLKGKTKFTENEIEKIYSFMKDKGYKGNKHDLFEYSNDSYKKEIIDNKFSYFLKLQMRRNDLNNVKFQNMLLKEGIDVDLQTISNWRNGLVYSPKAETLMAILKLFDISFDEYNQSDEYYDQEQAYPFIPFYDAGFSNVELEDYALKKASLLNRIYDLSIDYLMLRGISKKQMLALNKNERVEIKQAIYDFYEIDLYDQIVKKYPEINPKVDLNAELEKMRAKSFIERTTKEKKEYEAAYKDGKYIINVNYGDGVLVDRTEHFLKRYDEEIEVYQEWIEKIDTKFANLKENKDEKE